jgi:alpha-L-fucosidase
MKPLALIFTCAVLLFSCTPERTVAPTHYHTYDTTWVSLQQHPEAEWFHDAKFGIYTHWGPYAVPAYGNEWYPRRIYQKDVPSASHFYEHHVETWGEVSEFGYKDFVPMFTAEKFDADEWAGLFAEAGARFAGPVAEHHDGFTMWDSELTEWDAAERGPKRDITGELAKAIRAHGMHLVTSFHHAQNWWHYTESYAFEGVDTKDPEYAGIGKIYPPIHEPDDRPTTAYLEQWEGKVREVIDNYQPDYMWFDFGWRNPEFDPYKRSLLAYYYNREAEWDRELVVTYKDDHLPEGAGILDLERGKIDSLTAFKWITDTSIAYNSWCYVENLEYKTLNTLVDNLIDRVSKNGNLLLNVLPRADGSIPDEQKELLRGMGAWLKVYGDAIYGTRPWKTYGEGPTQHTSGGFSERGIAAYTSEDIRYTTKDGVLYVIPLARPESGTVVAKLLAGGGMLEQEVASVSLLGSDAEVTWTRDETGLTIEMPAGAPDELAFAFKVRLR